MNPEDSIDDSERIKLLMEQFKSKVFQSKDEIFSALDAIGKIISRNSDFLNSTQLSVATDCLRVIRQACPQGADVQSYIVNALPVIGFIESVFTTALKDANKQLYLVSLQVLANLIINHSSNQQVIWGHFNQLLVKFLQASDFPHKDMCLMLLHNIYCVGGLIQDNGKDFLKLLLQILEEEIHNGKSTIPEFLQLFLEHFVTKQKRVTPMYMLLSSNERILLLNFVSDLIKENHSGDTVVTTELLQCISKEFKKKSDCILKTETTYLNCIEPKEVMALVEVISQASADKSYKHVFADDGSLFLNIGCLLRNVQALGKNGENIFSPIQKLEQIAPSSTSNAEFEADVSYSLKTMLVRSIGNLACRNSKNQDLAREMEIMMAVLDCTHMDARNPLIKEWSILAIRNLCEGNMENQQLIASLTKVGDADNSDILKEFNIDLGSMRINPSV
ncbi:Ataxin-10 [Pseudolycoriella hygida]|uniref:Ataxin-10 n=1 Tax=Pseudolycoriella hygida TaxID=35572 RepID=A0A9Q0S0K3_9DIPT|nr:Ataxin-10 [Pseudolycoriella hygida]